MKSHVREIGYYLKCSGKLKMRFNGANVIRLTFFKVLFVWRKEHLLEGCGKLRPGRDPGEREVYVGDESGFGVNWIHLKCSWEI